MVAGVLGVVLVSHTVCVVLLYFVRMCCMTLRSPSQIPGGWANRSLGGLTGKFWIGLGGLLRCGRVQVVIPIVAGSGIQVRRSGFQNTGVRSP